MPPDSTNIIMLGMMIGDDDEHLSCKEIEALFDVSDRTVYRYIGTLRDVFGAPITPKRSEAKYACSTQWSMIEALWSMIEVLRKRT